MKFQFFAIFILFSLFQSTTPEETDEIEDAKNTRFTRVTVNSYQEFDNNFLQKLQEETLIHEEDICATISETTITLDATIPAVNPVTEPSNTQSSITLQESKNEKASTKSFTPGDKTEL